MRVRSIVLLALGAFLVTVVVKFPADVVFAHLNTEPLLINNPGGTVWRGDARSAGVRNVPNRLDAVRWTLNPLTLISGKLGADVEFDILGGNGNATVARAFNGDVFVNDAEIRIDAQAIEALFPAPLVQLGGRLELILEDGHFNPQHPESIRGRLIWSDAQLRDPVSAAFGVVTLNVTPNTAGHTAVLKNQGGVLALSGQVEIDKQGAYRADIRLQPLQNAPADLDSTLSLLGQKGSDGSYRLRQSGRLRDFL